MKKRITALLLALCLILSAAPVYAGAATGQQVSANAVTVTAGNTAYVTLEAKDFENIAALDVYVYYDASVFTVSGTTNGNMLSGAQASINTAVAGEIKLSALALDGMNGTGTLLTIRLSTAWGCAPGTYPIIVAVGRAHDGNLAEAVISGADGSVTVNKPAQAEYFYLYGDVSASTVRTGDTLSCYVYNSNSYSFVSGEFIFNYDHELFSFDAVTLAAGLTGEGAIHSVNSSVLGQVRIVYASDKPVSPHLLFTVSLKAIGDVDTTSTVKAQASNMYKEDLAMYQPGSWSRSVMFKKLQLNDYPNAFLRSEQMIVGQQSTSVFAVEAGSGMAAADFTLTYDPAVLRCVSVAAADGLSEKGGMIIINENFGDGMIRFSYVNMEAYDETELPLVVITWEPLQSPGAHYQITGRGVGVVDTDQKPVVLEYVPDSNCIFVRTVIAPTCLLDGYTDHVCACGENFQTDITQKLGHDIQHIPAQKVSCTQVGWEAYEGCTRCDYGGYVEIPALGHDEIHHEGKPVTCLEMGWEPYVTCSRCDHTTYVEIPALGHRVIQDRPALADPIEIRNESATPFQVIDGVYYSTNHADNSYAEFEIHALHDCEIKLTYSVSSEQNYDKLFLLLNGQQKDVISGFVTDKQRTLQLRTGDVLKIRYSKDGSAEAGEDRGWVKLDFEQLIMNVPTQVPAEEGEPTCTEAVVCIDCGTLIKEALGHIEVSHSSKAATCTEVGWESYVTCSRCDYTTYLEIPALGHDEIHHEGKAVTCLEIGWDAYVTCSRCDHTTYAQIPALGHNIIHYPGQQATCTEDGWDAHDGCSRCDYGNEERVPALGHDEIPHEGKEVTCLEIGWDAYVTCSRCDHTTYVEIPATGHIFRDKLCVSCGLEQPASKQWDLSTGADGSVMAYAYTNVDGTYFLEITGNGATKNYTSSSPFNSLNRKIGNICIRDGITDIGNFLFANLTIKGDITFADSVVSIGKNAFRYFAGPKIIALPENITTIGNNAFYYATNLVVILQGEKQPSDLGSNWDYYCGHYVNPQQVITTEDAIYVIDQNGKAWLAKYCADESEFVAETVVSGIPVTGIGDYAFSKKTNLITCTVPRQITDLGQNCFNQCDKLTIFFESEILPSSNGSWNSGNPYYLAPQSVMQFADRLYVVDQKGQLYLARYLGSDSTVTVEEEVAGLPVQHIGDYAFRNNSNLQTLQLPYGLQTIGAYAFQGNSRLQNLTLPDTVHTIGQRTFYNSALKNVVLPESLTEIPQYAFYGTKLTSVTIPQNVQLIDTYAFRSCSYLKVVYVLSEKIAAEITSTTSCGDLCRYAQTVVIPVSVENAWLTGTYSYVETGLVAGMTGIFYSKHDHSWQVDIISEMVPCQTDGVIQYTCTSCAAEKEWIEPCHDTLYHEPMAPTCTENGWEAYETCSRCDYSTYQELLPVGHRVIVSNKETVDPLSVKNNSGYPYAFVDGVYYSGNHTQGSIAEITFTALYDCKVQLYYGVSSEAYCDQLYILKNGSQLDVISGIDIQSEQTVSLAVGDMLTVLYQKDGSVDYGEDRGWVKLEYSFVQIGKEEIVPAETLEPTCTNSVVCSFCDAVVKEAVDHNYATSFTWNWDHTICQADFECVYNCGTKKTASCVVSVSGTNALQTTHMATACVDGKEFIDSMTCNHFLVRFQNWNGEELSRCYYHVGSQVTPPADPTREADDISVYTFAGWDKDVEICTGNITYTATYQSAPREYTVIFQNWDGTQLSEKTYHWGDVVSVPATPAKAADNTYTYAFAGWDKEVIACAGNATYTATYTPTYIDYTVIFQNWDGTQLSEKTYHWGDVVSAPATPAKAADNTYTYAFAGWDKEVIACAGNATYTATYTPTYIDYTVTFQNWDGTQLSEKTYHWGDVVSTPATPAKAADNTYTYAFAGWDKEVIACAGNATYTATYTPTYIDYTVTFQNWDGTQLSEKTYHWGDVVSTPATPAKAADNTYTYAFAGWDKEVIACAGNAIYTATYTPNLRDYTVVFQDWNGTVLSSNTYHWGDAVTAPTAPVRGPDNACTYVFASWDKEVTACAGDATYTATYTPTYIDYVVIFRNWDGTQLSQATYHWGDKVTLPADPTREGDAEITYYFAGWDKKVGPCNGDAVYTAVFTTQKIEYTIIFQNWDGTQLSKQTCYWGDAVTAPAAPKKAADNTYTYAFAGWDEEVVPCAGNTTYTATFTPIYIDYTVAFKDWNGAELSSNTYHWGEAVVAPAEPQRAADNTYTYAFAGWNKQVIACAGNATYTATYTAAYIDYTVTFQNWDGAQLSQKTYHWGDKVTPPANPTKEKDGYYAYTFAGWDKTVVNCAGDAVYQAVFTKEHYHTYDRQVTPPNCTEKGYTTFTCACGHSYQGDYVGALGHSYQTTVVKPTYTQKGYTDYVCHCGSTDRKNFKDPLGLPEPAIKVSVDQNRDMQVITWNAVPEATGYEIYRATSKSGKYSLVAQIEGVSWHDATASVGKTYYYKVKAVCNSDTSCNSGYSNIVSILFKCAAPEIAVKNDAKGKPYITWEKVTGAKKYTVYRATSATGKYSKLGTTTKAYYTDSKAKAGTTYFYKVIANASSSKYSSGYSNIVSCPVICGTPSVTVKIDSSTGKPSLSWKKVDGAANYAIYRDGQLLATTTGVSYADKAAAIDTQYTYAVQALGKTESLNGKLSNAVTATSGIAKPVLAGSINGVTGKPVISWQAVEGAVKYELYRSTKSTKSYTLLATVDTLSYTDETVSAGKTYYYKVKAIGEVSKSAESSYVKLTGKCATPVITVSVSESSGKPVLTWEKISGAKKYTVYYATSATGKYKSLGSTTKLTYTHTKATAGTVYFYKIVANASSSKYNSPYSNIVSCGVNCAAPAVKVSLNSSGKPALSWGKVTGAVRYEIYKNGQLLTTVTTTGYTDTAAQAGESCSYTVKAINNIADYNSAMSNGVTVTATCATPKITGKVGENKKPVITWGEVEGATKYIVYRSTSSSKNYKVIGETEALTYEDLTAAKSKTYYYKVVAVGDGFQSAQSGYAKVKSK